MKRKQPEKKKQIKRATAKKKEPVKEAPKKLKKAKEVPPPKQPKAKPVSKPTPVVQPAPTSPSVSAPTTLGVKRTCPKCSTKFYDFAKNPILCPKCGTEVDPEEFLLKIPRKAEQKKKSADKSAEAVLSGEDGAIEVDPIEAVEDLSDDDPGAEGIIVEDDDSDDEF